MTGKLVDLLIIYIETSDYDFSLEVSVVEMGYETVEASTKSCFSAAAGAC